MPIKNKHQRIHSQISMNHNGKNVVFLHFVNKVKRRKGKCSMEEYLTVKELCQRIKYAEQTIYNMISTKKFTNGVHYTKPTRKKILFIWAAILQWMNAQTPKFEADIQSDGSNSADQKQTSPVTPVQTFTATTASSNSIPKQSLKSLFNI